MPVGPYQNFPVDAAVGDVVFVLMAGQTDRVVRRTVKRFTATQIIVAGSNGTEIRFRRSNFREIGNTYSRDVLQAGNDPFCLLIQAQDRADRVMSKLSTLPETWRASRARRGAAIKSVELSNLLDMLSAVSHEVANAVLQLEIAEKNLEASK